MPKGTLAFEVLARAEMFEHNPDLAVYCDEAPSADMSTGVQQLSLPSPAKFAILPIVDKNMPHPRIRTVALILERAVQPDVVQSDFGDRLRSEFRRVGWIEYTYKPHYWKDKRSYYNEREFGAIVLLNILYSKTE